MIKQTWVYDNIEKLDHSFRVTFHYTNYIIYIPMFIHVCACVWMRQMMAQRYDQRNDGSMT